MRRTPTTPQAPWWQRMIIGQLGLFIKASHLVAFAWLLSNAFTIWQIQPLVEQSVAFYHALPATVKQPYLEALKSPNIDQANADLKMAGYAPIKKATVQPPELKPQFIVLAEQGMAFLKKDESQQVEDSINPTLP